MEVLVINCGSSSLKFQLIDSDSEKVLAKGICERIGIKGSLITYQPTGGEKEVSNIDMPTHHEAIDAVIKALTNKETGVTKTTTNVILILIVSINTNVNIIVTIPVNNKNTTFFK